MKKKIKFLVMLIVILALALSACANQQTPTIQNDLSVVPVNRVIAEGHIKPIHAVNLSFQARGSVAEISVKIGDHVSRGDVLVRLSNASLAEAQLSAANLELINAQQVLDVLARNGDGNRAAAWDTYQKAQVARAATQKKWNDVNPRDIQKRIDDQQATVNDREQSLQDAQDEFDKYKDLDRENSKRKTAEDKLRSAQKDYDTAVAELEKIQQESDSARAALDSAVAIEAEAKYQYELSADGVNSDQLVLAQARVDNAQAQVAAAESVLGNYVLIAPFDGVVVDVAVGIGEQVGVESRAVSVADTSSWVIETSDITELEVVDLAVGQKVTFTADALSGVVMNGVVTAISQSSFTQNGDVLYTVYIKAADVDKQVKWGMTVEVTFEPVN